MAEEVSCNSFSRYVTCNYFSRFFKGEFFPLLSNTGEDLSMFSHYFLFSMMGDLKFVQGSLSNGLIQE